MTMDNPFLPPDDGYSFTIGKSTTIEWNANTDGRVTLWLLHSNGPAQSTIAIAENIKNSGEYTWTPTYPDVQLTSGRDAESYTLLIGPGDGDVDSATNQLLITIRNSGSSPADTTATQSSQSAPSTSVEEPSTSAEDSIVTLTVTGPGASTSTTLGTLPEPSATSNLPQPGGDPGTEGLSSAEKTGIGVGVGVGVPFILILLGIFLWKRRKRSLAASKPSSAESEKPPISKEPLATEEPRQPSIPLATEELRRSSIHELPHEGSARYELSAKEILELSAKERLEIAEGRTKYELPADEKRAELGDHSKVPDFKS